MSEIMLPAELSKSVGTAQLPETYQRAVTALAECERLDECASWADKAAALASYARQADDPELENMARRIRARAARRCGELLKQFDGRGGDRSKSERVAIFAPPSRREVAEEAGLSPAKALTAVRIANIGSDEFEAYVEGPKPPGTTMLAQYGRLIRPTLETQVTTITGDYLRQIEKSGTAKAIIDALHRMSMSAERCDIEDVLALLKDEKNERVVPAVLAGIGFVLKLKSAMDKQGLRARPTLQPVS